MNRGRKTELTIRTAFGVALALLIVIGFAGYFSVARLTENWRATCTSVGNCWPGARRPPTISCRRRSASRSASEGGRSNDSEAAVEGMKRFHTGLKQRGLNLSGDLIGAV